MPKIDWAAAQCASHLEHRTGGAELLLLLPEGVGMDVGRKRGVDCEVSGVGVSRVSGNANQMQIAKIVKVPSKQMLANIADKQGRRGIRGMRRSWRRQPLC